MDIQTVDLSRDSAEDNELDKGQYSGFKSEDSICQTMDTTAADFLNDQVKNSNQAIDAEEENSTDQSNQFTQDAPQIQQTSNPSQNVLSEIQEDEGDKSEQMIKEDEASEQQSFKNDSDAQSENAKSVDLKPQVPHFVFKNVPESSSEEQAFEKIRLALPNYPIQSVQILPRENNESIKDIFLTLEDDKDACLALKDNLVTPVIIKFDENSESQMSHTDDLLRILQEAKQKADKLKKSNSSTKAQKENQKKANQTKQNNNKQKQSSEFDGKRKIIHKGDDRILIKSSGRKDEIPLEIKKPSREDKKRRSRSSSRDRHNHYHYSRGNGHSRRESSRERRYEEDHYRSRRSKSRSNSHSRRSKSRERRHRHRDSRSSSRERRYNGGRRRESPSRGQYRDKERHYESRSSYEQPENPDLVCYIIGIPTEFDEHLVWDLLIKKGFTSLKKVLWREFDGLEYLKVVFDNREDVQKILKQNFTLEDIPVIVMPKIESKTPLDMLIHHQIRVQSLSGPIDTSFIYEFLTKFGAITDLIVLDSTNHPTTFFVTYSEVSPKKQLMAFYPDKLISFKEQNTEKEIKFDINVKPALVPRRRIIQTIFYQYHESINRVPHQLFEYIKGFQPQAVNMVRPSVKGHYSQNPLNKPNAYQNANAVNSFDPNYHTGTINDFYQNSTNNVYNNQNIPNQQFSTLQQNTIYNGNSLSYQNQQQYQPQQSQYGSNDPISTNFTNSFQPEPQTFEPEPLPMYNETTTMSSYNNNRQDDYHNKQHSHMNISQNNHHHHHQGNHHQSYKQTSHRHQNNYYGNRRGSGNNISSHPNY